MKSMKNIFILGLILIYSSAFAQKPNIEESVEELRKLMITPTKEGLSSIAHYKLSYGHSLGKIENKEQFMDALVSKKTGFTDIKLSNQTIETIGKTAIVRHDFNANTLDNGEIGQIKLHILTVWLKQKKGWVLFARQAIR
jgi:hypothetical protein